MKKLLIGFIVIALCLLALPTYMLGVHYSKGDLETNSVVLMLRKQLFTQSFVREDFIERWNWEAPFSENQLGLAEVGVTLFEGFNLAISQPDLKKLDEALRQGKKLDEAIRYEGASMALVLLDNLTPWKKNRWDIFFTQHANDYLEIAYSGIGMAAFIFLGSEFKTHDDFQQYLNKFPPQYHPIIVDGFANLYAREHYQEAIIEQKIPDFIRGDNKGTFNSGIARSLWFLKATNIDKVKNIVQEFPVERQRDMWLGLGFEMAYIGFYEEASLAKLLTEIKEYRIDFSTGVAIAARYRLKENNLSKRIKDICQMVVTLSCENAVVPIERLYSMLQTQKPLPSYQEWIDQAKQELQQQISAIER